MAHVIQFFDLDDLINEVWRWPKDYREVRLERVVRSTPGSMDGIEWKTAFVTVRAVSHETILGFSLKVGGVNMVHGKPFGPEGAQEKLERRATQIERAMAEYLTDQGIEVRQGLIDIGRAEVVLGSWSGVPEPEPEGGQGGHTGNDRG